MVNELFIDFYNLTCSKYEVFYYQIKNKKYEVFNINSTTWFKFCNYLESVGI